MRYLMDEGKRWQGNVGLGARGRWGLRRRTEHSVGMEVGMGAEMEAGLVVL